VVETPEQPPVPTPTLIVLDPDTTAHSQFEWSEVEIDGIDNEEPETVTVCGPNTPPGPEIFAVTELGLKVRFWARTVSG